MSIYSQLSKKIGFEGPPIAIPTLQEAINLRTLVAAHQVWAFEQVFRYHRFCPSATNEQQRLSQKELHEAYTEGCLIFKDEE